MINFIANTGSISFIVKVVPRASKSEIVGELGGALKIRISSPPVDGAANAELIRLLSKEFDVPKNSVEILSGQSAKTKQVKISGAAHALAEQIFSRPSR